MVSWQLILFAFINYVFNTHICRGDFFWHLTFVSGVKCHGIFKVHRFEGNAKQVASGLENKQAALILKWDAMKGPERAYRLFSQGPHRGSPFILKFQYF